MAGASFLRQVPVLAGLSDELRGRLAAEAREVTIPAGAWLMREGEPADSLYVVRSGRLAVLAEGPPETLIRMLRRGEVVGELALLRAGTRSASVRAHRDSVLIELGREQFEQLIQEAPSFALGLTRSMGAQLAANRAPVFAAAPPRTIAVIGLDAGAPTREIADDLMTALRRHGSAGCLTADAASAEVDMAPALDRAEHEAERVLLLGGAAAPGDAWTDFCLREAELVIAVCAGEPGREWLDRPAALLGCELLVTGAGVGPATIGTLSPREVQVLPGPPARASAMEATARRLVGRSIGVVLSGGGARAFAHLGVLEELQAAGIVIDRIGAVSLGAIVGAVTAMGLPPEAVLEAFRQNFVRTNPSNDFTLPAYSLLRGGKTRSLLDGALGETRIEELPTRFFCLSCDLVAREPVVHRTGRVSTAVYASLAIPGVFPPVGTHDGRLLVDGGVLDNLPVATMARTGEGPIIAVDVTGRIGGARGAARPGAERIGRSVRRMLTGHEAPIPRLAETILRTVTAGSSDTVAAARLHADLVISPQVDGIGLMEWRRLDEMREAGRQAARAALAAAPHGML